MELKEKSKKKWWMKTHFKMIKAMSQNTMQIKIRLDNSLAPMTKILHPRRAAFKTESRMTICRLILVMKEHKTKSVFPRLTCTITARLIGTWMKMTVTWLEETFLRHPQLSDLSHSQAVSEYSLVSCILYELVR